MKKLLMLLTLVFLIQYASNAFLNSAVQESVRNKPVSNLKTQVEVSAHKPQASRQPDSQSATSLSKVTQALHRFTEKDASLRELLQFLEQEAQEPLVAHDSNPYSGEMAIVRTENPWPGTRYFHAQYFSNGEDQGFMQHMSVEFQAGPKAMSEARQLIVEAFQLKSPASEREGYALWHLENGYIVWIKQLSLEDLADDPFNAYSAADVGTIRVVVEADVHGES